MTRRDASRPSAARLVNSERNSTIARNLISVAPPEERALLVGAPLKRSGARHLLHEHLTELGNLADSAGAQVVGHVTQVLDRPNPGTYLGRGKLDELRARIEDTNASLVIFDDELTPAQGKNIEQATGRRVMDRTELILDIFATRARTSEAKMQVELAQLEYMLPRLARMWAHLEKFRGGIGMRGPGETQLETDRRLLKQRIRTLHERLSDVQRSRETQRQLRRGEFRASLVGYTNAGKSSVLRSLAEAYDVVVANRLFATLDPLTREVALDDHHRLLVTDTVGFIRKLPHDLVASFRATLEEVREADLLLHVIDASHSAWEEHRQVVNGVLGELGALDAPVLHVFNKTDRLAQAELMALHERVSALLPNSVFVSATSDAGLEPLRRALLGMVRRSRSEAEIRVPLSDGRMLAEVHRSAEVLEQRSEGTELVLRARVDEAAVGKLRRQGVTVTAG